MASIQINRGTTTEIENTPYRDGLISFDTDKKEILMDSDGERETYGANGTEVTANPEGQATGDLQKLGIGDDIYNISGGHTIQNTSGTAVTQRTKMRINGAYVHDDSTNQVTDVDIVRDMTKEELEALSGDEIEGFQHTTDEPDELQIDIPIPNELNDLDDVNIDENTLSGGQILTYNNVTKKWENSDDIEGTILKQGNPITFNITDGGVFDKAEVEFSSVQDLHGYDKPWVGGAGKNKLPLTVANIKSANTSGTWTDNTYAYRGITYELVTDSDNNIINIIADGIATADSELYLSTNLSTFLTQGTTYKFSCGNSSGSLTTYFLNVRDYNTGVDDISFTYGANNGNARLRVLNGAEVDNQNFYFMIRVSTESDTFEPYENICPITGYTELNIFQSNGSTTTPDETYTQSLGATYYGGTYDFATGKLTIDKGYVDLGSLTWTPNTAGSHKRFGTTATNVKPASANNKKANIICSQYRNDTFEVAYSGNHNGVIAISNNGSINVVDYNCDSLDGSQFKTAVNGVQLVYELATPTETTLTPTQISALVGDNVMWTDGDKVTVRISTLIDSEYVMYDNNTSVKQKLDELTPLYDTGSVVTSDTAYNGFYWGDVSIPTGRIVDEAVVTSSASNNPAFAQVVNSGATVRVYCAVASNNCTVKYRYHLS